MVHFAVACGLPLGVRSPSYISYIPLNQKTDMQTGVWMATILHQSSVVDGRWSWRLRILGWTRVDEAAYSHGAHTGYYALPHLGHHWAQIPPRHVPRLPMQEHRLAYVCARVWWLPCFSQQHCAWGVWHTVVVNCWPASCRHSTEHPMPHT
jgi:hypothetical protein